MPAFTFTMIAMQIGSAYYNYKRGCDQSKKLQNAQQAFTEKKNREGIANAKLELEQLLSTQREIETQMHEDRIVNINDSFKSNLKLIAYTASLKGWPLLVPPFVMKNEALPLIMHDNNINTKSSSRVAMHCILTNCTDTKFNSIIFPELEESMHQYLCRNWSMSSIHPILFYKRAWKNDIVDMGASVSDIKCHLNSLPTIVISPVITKQKGLFFRYSLWGMNNRQNNNDEFIDCEFIPSSLQYNYKCNDPDIANNKDKILTELIPALETFVSFVADRYYWSFDNIAPLLPTLFRKQVVKLTKNQINECNKQYILLFENFISDEYEMLSSPEKSLILLEGIKDTLSNYNDYKARICQIFISYCKKYRSDITSMDTALASDFRCEDLPFLKTYIKTNGLSDVYKDKIKTIIEFLLPLDFDYSILEMTDLKQLTILAEQGSAVAMFRLGEMYEYSIGVEWDDKTAFKYYIKSQNDNFELAKLKYSILKYPNIQINNQESIRILETGVDYGIQQINYYLSYCYFYGIGVEKKINTAIEFIEKLDSVTHSGALYFYGKLLLDKHKNYERGIELIKESADNGYVVAQSELVDIYYDGKYILKDYCKSYKWAQRSALQGYHLGLLQLGLCFLQGIGIQQSREKGIDLIATAAKYGNKDAIETINKLKQNI